MGQLLCLDFDGVMNSYTSGWIKEDPTYLPDDAVPGCFAFINQARQHFDIVIHSSRLRYEGAERSMRNWMVREAQKQGFNLQDAEDIEGNVTFSVAKPPAHVTLDDRAIQFNGVFPDLDAIIDFRPWNKRANLIDRSVAPRRMTPDDLFEILLKHVGDTRLSDFEKDKLSAASDEINVFLLG